MTYLPKELQKVVGTRPIRPDGVDKVTGRAVFAADTRATGMLWGKILRSPHAHARIVSIDTKKAEALPGVRAVVTSADFPGHQERGSVRRRRPDEFPRSVLQRDGALQGFI
jgi:CO/xanthine dehydrogenase Mo-binding subunit